MPQLTRLLWPGLFAFSLSLLASPIFASVEKDFLAARDAYAKGRMVQFQGLATRIPENHLLAPYIRYWQLKSTAASDAEMQRFIDQHADTPLSERMRQEVIRKLAQAEDWTGVLEQLTRIGRTDAELQCHGLRARMIRGDGQAIAETALLYRTPRDLPSACEPLFTELFNRGMLGHEDRYQRLRLALEQGNLRLARELDAQLPESERMQAKALDDAKDRPESLLNETSPRRAQREAALYALHQIARNDPSRAARLWQTAQASHDDHERAYGWAGIATAAARRHNPEAPNWFAQAGNSHLSELQRQWKTRAALRAGRWAEVLQSINTMSTSMQNEPVWRYWKARALKAMNATAQANTLFARLSTEFHYYGLLAEEELPTRIEARPREYKPGPRDIAAAEAHPGLQRALLLRRLKLDTNATEEWNWAIRTMNDAQLLAAAEVARRETWYDRAIVTAERTRDMHDFDLRYMTPYRDLAETWAARNNLDPAWVYGLMRQESRFIDHARSRVGATGLMQIMPATARWIAGQLGLNSKNAAVEVKEPETNIRFGTYYLKRIHDSLDQSPVLATAAYNAGPGRARRWQAEAPLEGAIYVESIPFLETRDYVKKVMANAIHYSHRFGNPGSLKARLGEIPARPDLIVGRDEAAPQPD